MDNRGGFTLIELTVVCAIIGLLAVLAIPNYFMFRENSLNEVARSDARNLAPAAELAASRTSSEVWIHLDGTGGRDQFSVPGEEVPGGNSSAGVVGLVRFAANEYDIETWHQNGSLCYAYYSGMGGGTMLVYPRSVCEGS